MRSGEIFETEGSRRRVVNEDWPSGEEPFCEPVDDDEPEEARVPTLEEMAQAIAAERQQLDAALAHFRALKGPYDAAVDEKVRLQRSVKAMEKALETAKAVHLIDAALEDAGIEYVGPRVVASKVYQGSQFYLLAAVGPEGTGLYVHKPERSGRYSGTERVVLLAQAVERGFDPSVHRGHHHERTNTAQEEVGLVAWQARGKGDFGMNGAYKPSAPPEGGKWRWLKVREQATIEAGGS